MSGSRRSNASSPLRRRTTVRGWIDALQSSKDRKVKSTEDLHKELVGGADADLAALCPSAEREFFEGRLKKSRKVEESRWHLRNPTDKVAVGSGKKFASSRYGWVSRKVEASPVSSHRMPRRIPDALLGKFGLDDEEDNDDSTQGTSSRASTPRSYAAAFSLRRPYSPLSVGERSGANTPRSHALLYRTHSRPSSAQGWTTAGSAAFRERDATAAGSDAGAGGGDLMMTGADSHGAEPRVFSGHRRDNMQTGSNTKAKLMSAPSERLETQLLLASGGPILPPAERKLGIADLVKARNVAKRLAAHPSPRKERMRAELDAKRRAPW